MTGVLLSGIIDYCLFSKILTIILSYEPLEEALILSSDSTIQDEVLNQRGLYNRLPVSPLVYLHYHSSHSCSLQFHAAGGWLILVVPTNTLLDALSSKGLEECTQDGIWSEYF
jgi:hypothetical protein